MRSVRAVASTIAASTLASLALVAPARADTPGPRFSNELTVWVIPAPRPAELSWKTPGGLIRDVVTNAVGAMLHIMNRKLGHMGVTLRCAAQGSRPAFTWQGSMTNAVKAEFNQIVVKEAYGLGVLFHNFTGRLERADELQASIDERVQNGRIAWVRYGVSAPTCQRLQGWLADFHRAGVDQRYGLASRPRYREGAGCSAFSMSFVEQAGLLEPALTPWSFSLDVPLSLVGGPLTGRRVPLAKALATTRGWATPGEPSKHIFGWDPTLAFYWIKNAAARVSRGERVFTTDAVVERRTNALGLVLDRRAVPTPTDALFKN